MAGYRLVHRDDAVLFAMASGVSAREVLENPRDERRGPRLARDAGRFEVPTQHHAASSTAEIRPRGSADRDRVVAAGHSSAGEQPHRTNTIATRSHPRARTGARPPARLLDQRLSECR